MASKTTTLTVKILTDASGAKKGADEAATTYDKLASGVNKAVPAAAAVVGALALAGGAAASAASRTEQAFGALDSVFGKNASVVKSWADDAAQSVGLAKSEYAELASVIGAQLNNLGLSSADALAGTQDLISLGADLAATFGGTTAEAVEALSAALRGEADPAERYGLSLNQTAVNAALAAQGLSGLEGDALRTAKTQTILALATEQAGGAMGQFGREADTAAGQQQRANAEFQNAVSELGTALLPVVTEVSKAFADMAKWVSQNSTLVLTLAGVVGGLAVGILALSAAMKAYAIVAAAVSAVQKALAAGAIATRIGLAALAVQQIAVAAATKIAAAAQWLLNAALSANPIGLIIAAIAVVIGLLIYLWNTNEGFRDAVIAIWQAIADFAVAAWQWIVDAATAAWAWIVSAAEAVGAFFVGLWQGIADAAMAVWNGIVSAIQAAWNFIISIAQMGLSIYIGIWSAILNFIVGIWNSIVSAVAGAINGAVNIVRGAVSAIQQAFANIGNFIASIWQNMLNAARSVFNTLRDIVTNVFNAIMVPINAVVDAFNAVINAVKSVIDWISRIKIPDVLGSIGNLFSAQSATVAVSPVAATAFAAPGVQGLARGSLATTVGSVGLRGGGGFTQINVSGGLDSADTIARRIEGILTGRARRNGGVVLNRRVR